MRIGSHDTDRDVFVIAEVGNNHEGSLSAAEELIGLAARAGADAVKFQTIVPERLVPPTQPERLEQLGRFSFTYEQFTHLAGVARNEGIAFMSTPFDLESASFLEPLVPAYKIASGDNDFVPLLQAVARTGKPVIFSAGLCDMGGVERSLAIVREARAGAGFDPASDVGVLHCTVSYPTAPEEVALSAIREIADLGVVPGYSDHTLGIEAAVLSVAAGARIVEKHFTYDKSRDTFRDHALSADPGDLATMVQRIREANVLLGAGKCVQPSESAIASAVRRGIGAGRDMKAGHEVAFEDLTWLRGLDGLRPGDEDRVVGRRLARDLAAGEAIHAEDVS